jgi:CheY-like chemotaxis protein
MNQQVICEHLERVGLRYEVAENGLVGVNKVLNRMEKGEKQFDLIFMDMHMPIMDGLEASAKILELKLGIPIVALTANIMSHDRELYRNSGMVDYVGKPFTSQELWRCLLRFFAPKKWQAEDNSNLMRAEDELLGKLINNFVNNNRDKHKEIVNALSAGDIKLAHRLAHTLKSNAAQLGRTGLQKAAGVIEDLLAKGENRVTPSQLRVFKQELTAAIIDFEPLVQKAKPSQLTTELLDETEKKELLDELIPLLKMGNPMCLSLIDKLRAIPDSEELIKRMENFDFELAIESLTKLM